MKQTLIQNIQVWTMDEQDTRFSGWVLLEDDKIAATGEGRPPACAEVLDGEGGVLTPGLIDIHSHLGLYEDGLGFEGADGNEDTDQKDGDRDAEQQPGQQIECAVIIPVIEDADKETFQPVPFSQALHRADIDDLFFIPHLQSLRARFAV